MKKYFLLAIILLGIQSQTFAQEEPSDEALKKIHSYFGKEQISLADSARMYEVLLENTPIEPEFKSEPRFAVVGYNGKFYFSMGARLRFTASYDIGNPVDNPAGINSAALKPVVNGNNHLFQMTAGTSRLYFNIIGFPNTHNQVGLFVSFLFDKNSDNSYIIGADQIYMRYRHFQCGYVSSLYNDRMADAYSIDDHGPSASGSHNTVQINYQHSLSKHLHFGVGVELPSASYTQTDITDEESATRAEQMTESYQNVPDFPLYLMYSGRNGHIRLSAVLRTLAYYNLYTSEKKHETGYGIKLTGRYKLGNVTFLGMVQGGRAIANYLQDNRSVDVDLVPSGGVSGHNLVATHSIGMIGAVQYDILPKLFVTGQVSFLRNYIPYYDVPAEREYKDHTRRGISFSANAIWKISDLFSTGIEYLHVRRTSEGYNTISNNRIYYMFMMNF